MRKFNGGKAYHGSEAVQEGRLRGATDTDYFYFFCPRCPDDEMLRVLDYEVRADGKENPYNEQLGRPKAARGFILAFKLHCQRCGFTDFTKVGNLGWQGGKHSQALGSGQARHSPPMGSDA
jgi:ribosomal protein S27AE